MILLTMLITIVAKENVPLPYAHHKESRALLYGSRYVGNTTFNHKLT